MARDLQQMAAAYYRTAMTGVFPSPPEKIAADALNLSRSREQLDVLRRYVALRPGTKLLEIGCGFGALIAAARAEGIEAHGIEPDPGSHEIACENLRGRGIDPSAAVLSAGEQIPFADASFDVVYLNHVIEHVRDVPAVLAEAIRLARPGGRIVCVAPNYGSFFEGHYGLLWIPYMPKAAARAYVRLFGRNPAYIDELNFVTMGMLRRVLAPRTDISLDSWGIDLWEERMDAPSFSAWAELGTLKRALGFFRKLGMIPVIKTVTRLLRAYNPLVMVLTKKG